MKRLLCIGGVLGLVVAIAAGAAPSQQGSNPQLEAHFAARIAAALKVERQALSLLRKAAVPKEAARKTIASKLASAQSALAAAERMIAGAADLDELQTDIDQAQSLDATAQVAMKGVSSAKSKRKASAKKVDRAEKAMLASIAEKVEILDLTSKDSSEIGCDSLIQVDTQSDDTLGVVTGCLKVVNLVTMSYARIARTSGGWSVADPSNVAQTIRFGTCTAAGGVVTCPIDPPMPGGWTFTTQFGPMVPDGDTVNVVAHSPDATFTQHLPTAAE
jgi:hypothetical protein